MTPIELFGRLLQWELSAFGVMFAISFWSYAWLWSRNVSLVMKCLRCGHIRYVSGDVVLGGILMTALSAMDHTAAWIALGLLIPLYTAITFARIRYTAGYEPIVPPSNYAVTVRERIHAQAERRKRQSFESAQL